MVSLQEMKFIAAAYGKYLDYKRITGVLTHWAISDEARLMRTTDFFNDISKPTTEEAIVARQLYYTLNISLPVESLLQHYREKFQTILIKDFKSWSRLPNGTDIDKVYGDWLYNCIISLPHNSRYNWSLKTLKLIVTGSPKEIREAYICYDKTIEYSKASSDYDSFTGYNDLSTYASPQGSCLRKVFYVQNQMLSYHPVECYGGRLRDDRRLKLVYLKNTEGKTVARTLVNTRTKEYIRLYVQGSTRLEQLMLRELFKKLLKTLGFSSYISEATMDILLYLIPLSQYEIALPYTDKPYPFKINKSGFISRNPASSMYATSIGLYRFNKDISFSQFDIVRLGHLHKRRLLNLANQRREVLVSELLEKVGKEQVKLW